MGMPPPRPRPVKNRSTASDVSPAAKAVSRENSPNTAVQPINTGFRPSRSPNRPADSAPNSSPKLPAVSAVVNCGGFTCHASINDGIA